MWLTFQATKRCRLFYPVKEFDDDKYIVFLTKKGLIKKTKLSAFSNRRNSGIMAISFGEGDSLKEVMLSDGQSEIFIATKQGKAIRFNESHVRDVGRGAKGVKGISLAKKDEVVGLSILPKEEKEVILSGYRAWYG